MASAASTPSTWSGPASTYAASAAKRIPEAASEAALEALQVEVPVGDLPVVFIDVAAGPGILAMLVAARLAASHIPGRVIITDFSPGMVDAAKKRVEAATASGDVPSNITMTCQVMDAEALDVATASVTHAGCMFGIMFFPHRDVALRELRRVLVDSGRAVVGTWNVAGLAVIVDDFARYIGAPPSDASAPLQIGKDPERLREELLAAGFRDVTVKTATHRFTSPEWDGMLQMLRGNPMISQSFKGAPAETNWEAAWHAFLSPGGPGAKYAEDGVNLAFDNVANLAIATA